MSLLSKKKILLLEETPDLSLSLDAYKPTIPENWLIEKQSHTLLEHKNWDKPDLLLLDLLPSQKGHDLYQKVKKITEWHPVPLFLFSHKEDELDMVLCLEEGVEEFFCKPLSPRILLAKIKKIFGREENSDQELKFGEFSLNIDTHELLKNNSSIHTTLSEFLILKKFLLHKGKILTRNQFLDDIQTREYGISVIDRNIDVHIASLRKKLGSRGSWIQTVRGIGYRFKEDPSLKIK